MRIWFKIVERKPNHSSMFDGDVECRIRLEDQETDIVFHTSCADEGIREVMADLLNVKLNNAIEEGALFVCLSAPRVVQEYPPETERDDADLAAFDEPEDQTGEEVDSIGEDEGEEQAVHRL